MSIFLKTLTLVLLSYKTRIPTKNLETLVVHRCPPSSLFFIGRQARAWSGSMSQRLFGWRCALQRQNWIYHPSRRSKSVLTRVYWHWGQFGNRTTRGPRRTPTKGLGSFSRLVFNARRSSRMIKMCTCMGKSFFLWLSFPLVYFLVIKHCFYNQTGQALNGFVLDYIIICLNMCFY